MADWLRDFVDVIVPRTCCVCGRRLMRGEEIMCLHCVADLPRTGVHGDDADNDIAPRLVSRRVGDRTGGIVVLLLQPRGVFDDNNRGEICRQAAHRA